MFSLDPTCREPMRPELMTRRMRQLRKRFGIGTGDFDATILALRHWTTSEPGEQAIRLGRGSVRAVEVRSKSHSAR